MTRSSSHIRELLAAALLSIALSPAHSQTFTWNVTNGSFTSAASWTPVGGPPGVAIGVTAEFQGASSLTNYLATFSTDWAVNNLNVNQGTTTLSLSGNTLTAHNLTFGDNASQTTTLNIINGTFLTPGGESLATGSSANFTLNLNNATFSSNNYIDLASGASSIATVNILNGSTYSALGNSFIGIVGTANMLVDGPGSSMTLANNSRIGSGNGSSGGVNVQNSGAFNSSGSLTIGVQTGATGFVTVSGNGSTWTHTDGTITVGGGNAGAITVNAGATMNVTGSGSAANIVLNTNSAMLVTGTVNVTGAGQSGITLNGGNLTINANGKVTADYFTRNTGASLLTINDGMLAVNKQFDLAFVPLTLSGNTATANPTLQLQNGASANGITTLTLGNAAGRRGTLNVLGGSSATFSSTITVGNTGLGTLLLDGPGSQIFSTQAGGMALIIGQSGSGSATVQNGGSYLSTANASIALGAGSGGNGILTVTGAGSSAYTGGMTVGQGGSGTVNILNGASVTTVGSIGIGEANIFSGKVNVSGAGSTLNDGFSLIIGGTSGASSNNNSQLNITNGGSVTAGMTIGSTVKLWNGSSLTIDSGGSAAFGNFDRLGTLNLYDGTLTITSGFTNGAAPSTLIVQGQNAGDVATLEFTNGASTTNITSLTVGATRTGVVNVQNGANLSVTGLNFASSSGGNGSITLSGANSKLDVNGSMTFGANGSSTLSIGAGTTAIVAGTLSLGASGTINLYGGTLNIGTFTPNGGAVNWSSGTVAFTGTTTLGVSELGALLGPSNTLSAGRTLKGSPFSGNPMTLNGNLSVSGGTLSSVEIINAATLSVSAGSVQSTNSLTNNSGGVITVASGATLSGPTINFGEIQLGGGSAKINGNVTNSGRIVGGGAIGGGLTNNGFGTVTVDAGQRLVVAGLSTNNAAGTINLNGGTLEFTGFLTNSGNAFISGRGTLNTSAGIPGSTGLSNSGVMSFSGGFTDIRGDVTHNAGGVITNSGAGIVTFYDDVVSNADIRTFAGSRTVFLGNQSGAGNFPGTGVVEYAGDLRPGNSPASTTYGGDLVLGQLAGLHIELGGTIAGSQYDQINVLGTVFLGGGLDVTLYNGFQPHVGDRFDIATYGTRVGAFSSMSGLDLGNGLALVPFIDGHTYSLVVSQVPEPGTLALLGAAAACGYVGRRRMNGAKSPVT